MSCRSHTLLLKTPFQLTHPIETYPFGMDFCRLLPAILHFIIFLQGTAAKLQHFHKTNKFSQQNFLLHIYTKRPIN